MLLSLFSSDHSLAPAMGDNTMPLISAQAPGPSAGASGEQQQQQAASVTPAIFQMDQVLQSIAVRGSNVRLSTPAAATPGSVTAGGTRARQLLPSTLYSNRAPAGTRSFTHVAGVIKVRCVASVDALLLLLRVCAVPSKAMLEGLRQCCQRLALGDAVDCNV
jgi:hypothetical protein